MINKQNKGSALIMVTVVVVMITGISFALFFTSTHHYNMSRANQATITCQYINKGAMQVAAMLLTKKRKPTDAKPIRIEGEMNEIRDGAGVVISGGPESFIYRTEADNTWRRVLDDAPEPFTAGSPAARVFDVKTNALSSRPDSSFRVEIFNNEDAAPSKAGVIVRTGDIPHTALNTARAFIAEVSSVMDGSEMGLKGFLTETTADNTKTQESTPPGIIGYRSVTLTGNGIVDSYNSESLVPYGTGNQNENGDVATNGIIALSGNGAIFGDAVVPDPETDFSGSESAVSGDVIQLPEPIPAPSSLDDSWKNSPLNNIAASPFKDLSKPGQTVTLGATDQTTNLHFTNVAVKASVIIRGTVNLFVDQDFVANSQGSIQIEEGGKLILTVGRSVQYNGQFSSVSNDPEDFVIQSTNDQRSPSNTAPSITFNGGSNIAAVVNAPFSNVLVSGGNEFFGLIIGQRVELTGNPTPSGRKFHYDEDIGLIQVTEITPSEVLNYFVNSTVKNPFNDLPTSRRPNE